MQPRSSRTHVHRNFLALQTISLSLLAGCVSPQLSNPDAGTDGAPTADTSTDRAPDGRHRSVEEFLPAMYAAQRDWFARCYTEVFFPGAIFNLSDFDDATLAAVARKVREGGIRYDEAIGEQCLAALAGSCDLQRDLSAPGTLPICSQVLVGLSPAGASCQASIECATGTCDLSAGQCPGVCAAQVGAGGRCQADATCSSGLICFAGYCVEPLAEGATCDSYGFPNRARCAQGLICMDVSSTDASTCARPLVGASQGQRCLSNGLLCNEGLSCVLGVSGQHTCQPQFAANQACSTGVPNSCPRGYDCNGVCQPIPTAGQPCLYAGSSFPRCATGLLCNEGTCREPWALGEACTWDGCRYGSCVDNVCVAAPLFCS